MIRSDSDVSDNGDENKERERTVKSCRLILCFILEHERTNEIREAMGKMSEKRSGALRSSNVSIYNL